MALNVNDLVKVSFVVMSLPYVVVTIFLLLVCFRKLTQYFGFAECQVTAELEPEVPQIKVKKVPKSRKLMLPLKMDPSNVLEVEISKPLEEHGQREQFASTYASGIDFFDTPGICQQTRFDSRVVTFDKGNGAYTKDRRQPLSAAQYLEFYNTPYYF